MSGDPRSTPTRRGLLAGAAALPAAGALAALAGPSSAAAAPAAAAGADAELIRDCAGFVELQRQGRASGDSAAPDADDDEMDRLLEPIETRQLALLDRICITRAVTLEGHRARARALWDFAPGVADDFQGKTWDARLLRAVFSDLVGSAVA